MITRESWLQALVDVQRVVDDPGVLTLKEFGELVGLHHRASQCRQMTKLLAAGRAERSSKRIQRVDGRWTVTTAYRLLTGAPMARTTIDIDDSETLDGAETHDHALKPDDDDEPNQCRIRANPRAGSGRPLPKMRRKQRSPAKVSRVQSRR